MSAALVPVDDLVQLAEKIAPSQLLPEKLRGKIPDVLAIVVAGRELGLAPMASLRCLNVIEGKPVLNADGMVGIVRGSGKCESFDLIESTDKIATFETKRVGGKVQRLSFTIEEAKLANLTSKDNWKRFPAAMLRARAQAALCRLVYQDVLAGVYSDDEAAEFARTGSQAAPVIDAETVEVDVDEWHGRLLALASIDELKALRAEFDALPECQEKVVIADMVSKRRSALAREYADQMTKGGGDAA
jgi:hypothetical protein